MTTQLSRAPLTIVEETARELIAANGLALARIWILEPPQPKTGSVYLAAVATAQPNVGYGGMLEASVVDALRATNSAPLMVPTPADDPRFSGALPTGGFAGFPIVAGDLRYGFVEVYAGDSLTFAQAADLERSVAALANVLGSAYATTDAESSDRGRILIADDDPGIRSLVKLLLTRRGFQVTDVSNGLLAYETARREKPDLVLIDWVMPIMDGREATTKLKADPETRHIPVVMLTSQSRIDDKVAALESGAQDFVTKPFDSRELVARVEQQMRWRKLLAADAPDDGATPLSVHDAPASANIPAQPGTTAPPRPIATSPAAQLPPLDPALFTGDSWSKAVEYSQLGKHREALALYLHEAERCEEVKQFPKAAIAYRSGSVAAGQMQNLDLSNKLLRLAGKMYLCWSETTQDTRAIQEGYLNAARCFLTAGNLKLAKKSVDSAHSFEAVLSDERPPSLA